MVEHPPRAEAAAITTAIATVFRSVLTVTRLLIRQLTRQQLDGVENRPLR